MSNKSIQRLDHFIEKYLNQSAGHIQREWERPKKYSDDGIWFYKKCRNFIFHDEIGFILDDGIVVDITLTEYTFGVARKSVFYYEGQSPEYRVIKI
ncbi:hypothetical protein CMU84_17695 [Elizabethkingia anophelis]|nr:hypothetical protein [Elizabethkingia anophelis]MDV3636982.1 hypothetical protein [Elizabethkingia anophelis]MDV3710149.1 hypothetical protein [Elizabethkingia anophelis]MDV3733634.1 hypothetical protein [Elizabethkingia anophelis]